MSPWHSWCDVMVDRDEFNALEHRVDQVEKTLVEIQTLVKVLRPVAILLAAGIGMDIAPFLGY